MTAYRGKEVKTPEEKASLLKSAVEFIVDAVEGGKFKGNITLPIYDGIVGQIKVETFTDPMTASTLGDRLGRTK